MAQQELKKYVGGGDDHRDVGRVRMVFDCIVCLCEVEPEEDGCKKLTSCDHGERFHCGCIESWLKEHSTCPLCRTHVPKSLCHRLNVYLFKLQGEIVSYCNMALENMASSIGDCHDS
ncbi:hypothetical protein QVD17_31992 [Tagetes erecta]|uniref:RING-type domain-containing protein n=1 Tax=Tagetes erecta TaxID=13708 RepID=A0AAD8K5E8_TARER|nr:hypothetical protein QVD17_31992 [Tagetes erecta]